MIVQAATTAMRISTTGASVNIVTTMADMPTTQAGTTAAVAAILSPHRIFNWEWTSGDYTVTGTFTTLGYPAVGAPITAVDLDSHVMVVSHNTDGELYRADLKNGLSTPAAPEGVSIANRFRYLVGQPTFDFDNLDVTFGQQNKFGLISGVNGTFWVVYSLTGTQLSVRTGDDSAPNISAGMEYPVTGRVFNWRWTNGDYTVTGVFMTQGEPANETPVTTDDLDLHVMIASHNTDGELYRVDLKNGRSVPAAPEGVNIAASFRYLVGQPTFDFTNRDVTFGQQNQFGLISGVNGTFWVVYSLTGAQLSVRTGDDSAPVITEGTAFSVMDGPATTAGN